MTRTATSSRLSSPPVKLERTLIHQPWTAQRWLPLSQAIWGGQSEIAQFLIDQGADVAATVDDGSSLLELARYQVREGKGSQAIVDLLLAHGAGAPN
jgi:ankyrin repeat protein